ncbi:MAG: FCD domain-containing protein [Alphaproteobacteria bacterium]|nr:FCD domain-containing protein [Alphaproteobacteria bacterium]
MERPESADIVEQIKRFIADKRLGHNQKLPPERQFCRRLGVSRVDLRKALACMEEDGLIWRHVGRGTFIGSRPVHNLDDVAFLRQLANPAEMMDARLAIEPELARLAALHRTQSEVDAIHICNQRCRAAEEWRSYEAWDNNFHHAIAKATHNKVLLYLFDSFNVVRRSIVWGQARSTKRPATDHFSFDQHDAIHAAIAAGDATEAAACMRNHLRSVAERVLPAMTS